MAALVKHLATSRARQNVQVACNVAMRDLHAGKIDMLAESSEACLAGDSECQRSAAPHRPLSAKGLSFTVVGSGVLLGEHIGWVLSHGAMTRVDIRRPLSFRPGDRCKSKQSECQKRETEQSSRRGLVLQRADGKEWRALHGSRVWGCVPTDAAGPIRL